MKIVRTSGFAALLCAGAFAGPAIAQGHSEMPGMNMSGMGSMTMTAGGDAAKVGELEISGGFAKAMLPGQPVGGGFFSVKNNGATDDRLVSVTSPISDQVQIHEMSMQGNVMKMRELKDGIAIPAGKSVELTPGNLHLMFQKVKTPFRQGDKVPVTLTFEKAGKVDLVLDVLSAQGK